MTLTYTSLNGQILERVDKYFGKKNSLIEINPGKVFLPPQFREIGQSILDAPVRKDDVWLLSYPRTGSTWTQEMVWLIGNDFNYEGAKSAIQPVRTPLIELSALLATDYESYMHRVESSVDVVNCLPSPRFIKSHLPLQLLPKQLENVKPKIIYVARNPKDMCVSYYHYCQLIHNLDSTFEEFCELMIDGKAPFGCVFNHYLGFWNKRHESNIMFIKYEDMKKNQKEMIRNTAKFMRKSITDDQVNKLTEHLNFKNMRNNPAVNLKWMESRSDIKFCEEEGKSFIRKGEVGDWKNFMSVDLSKKFDEWTEKNLKDTGLSFE